MKRLMVLMMSVMAFPAFAQGLRGDLFPSDGACYLRFYDKAHLAAHPDQRVVQIAVGPDAQQTTVEALALRVQLLTRDSDDFFSAVAYCAEGNAGLRCMIEGDGGGFAMVPVEGRLQLTLDPGGISIEGATGFLELSGTKGDDRVFRLPQVPADSCP